MRKKNTIFMISAVLVLCAAVSAGGILVRKSRNQKLRADVLNALNSEETAVIGNDYEEYPMYEVIGDDFVPMKETASDDSEEINKVYPGSIVEFMGDAADGYAYIRGKGSTVAGYVKQDSIRKSDFVYSLAPLTVVDTDTSTYSYEEMVGDIAELDEKYDAFSSEVVAQTQDKRDVYKLKIGNGSKKMLFYGALNGTDYMTTQLLMKQAEYYAHYMTDGLFNGYRYADLFDNVSIEIVPMVNPDGVSICQWGADILTDSQMSENVKNVFYTDRDYGYSNVAKTIYYSCWKSNASGVDITRNFPDGFSEINTLRGPSHKGYKGTEAFSEIESKTLANIIDSGNYCCVIGYKAEGGSVSYIGDLTEKSFSKAEKAFANGISAFSKYPQIGDTSSYTYYGSTILYSVNKGVLAVEIGLSSQTAPLTMEALQEPWTKLRELPAFIAQQFLDEQQ